MKLPHSPQSPARRRGAALLLSVMVLFVLIAIVFQISIGTMTDARIGRNDVGLTLIDRAIASAQWDVMELLRLDGEEAGGAAGDAPTGGGPDAGGEAAEEPADSRKDEWASPQRTEINGIELRVLVEAENSKYNVLNILIEDEEQAEEAYQRVVRVIDNYREGTRADISQRQAEDMVREMKEFMADRNRTNWPQATLLTASEEHEGLFLPMSLRDFLVLESWEPYMFRSYRDEDDAKVHSLDQFLTVWSSPGVADDLSDSSATSSSSTPTPDAPDPDPDESGDDPPASGDPAASGQGTSGQTGDSSLGYAVNINLAPAAVLASLFDDREVNGRFWDDVLEYRNLEEEAEDGESSDEEPLYDEFNEEIIDRRAFESLEELSEVRSWDDNDTEMQTRILDLLVTQSQVFTIYITARSDMSVNGSSADFADPREQARMEEEPSGALVRTVRSVVWRRTGDDGTEVVTIVPWEVVETVPHEIEDYPEEY